MKRIPWVALLLALAVFVGSHFWWLSDLPEKLATHFGADGRANGWMPRRDHGGLMLLLGCFTPGLIVVLSWAMRYMSPSVVNLPNAAYWRAPEHYPEACEIMLRWALWLGTALLLWLTWMNHHIVLANRVTPPVLDMRASTWLLVGFISMTVGFLAWLWWRFKQPARQP